MSNANVGMFGSVILARIILSVMLPIYALLRRLSIALHAASCAIVSFRVLLSKNDQAA